MHPFVNMFAGRLCNETDLPTFMLMKIRIVLLLLVMAVNLHAQVSADSSRTLDSVVVKVFETSKPVALSSSVVSIPPYADFTSKTSLVNGLNAVAGVRMEERSPGSYRISIRGSSLRSPFGVRNIKVYWNGIPLTDPGGNTYFNQLASNNIGEVQIAKGPAGSMYGAGTGGVILLFSNEDFEKPGIRAEYIRGSYGLQNLFLNMHTRSTDARSKNWISFAHNETDGYRVQSALRRDNFSWYSRNDLGRFKLSSAVLFTDMKYETPGALTTAEFNRDPQAARPAAGGFPSAVSASASIWQRNLLGGISAEYRFSPHVGVTAILFGSFAHIKNPAIRNYERRLEPSAGSRSFFRYEGGRGTLRYKVLAGAEWQQGFFNTAVSKNKNGNPDSLQTHDDIDNRTVTVFTNFNADINQRWFLNAGLGNTGQQIKITRLFPAPVSLQKRNYKNQWLPSLSLMRRFFMGKASFNWHLAFSKGFSSPTTAEVLPSTGVISTGLEGELGWNKEMALAYYSGSRKLKLQLTAFYFRLYDALVQRRDSSGADYFVNAGDTKQKGIEFSVDFKTRVNTGWLRTIAFRSDLTINHFRYGSFIKGTEDYSGKRIPSVPAKNWNGLLELEFRYGLYLNLNLYTASSIYLNDANTVKDGGYHLAGMQAGYKWKIKKAGLFHGFAGVDNLLNETYSLGNDINAAAGRYFNAAPKRNYFAGLRYQWQKGLR